MNYFDVLGWSADRPYPLASTTNVGPYALVRAGNVLYGSLAATDGQDTASATGKVLINGALAATDGQDSASASGRVLVTGTLAATDGQDVAAFTGSVASVITGTLAATDGQDVAAFTGSVIAVITGTLAATEAQDTALFQQAPKAPATSWVDENARAYGKKKRVAGGYTPIDPGENVDWAAHMQAVEEDEIVLAVLMAAAPILGAPSWHQ